MSRNHSPSQFPARTQGPPYCLGCGADWPCSGHLLEEQDARQPAARVEELDVETLAIALASSDWIDTHTQIQPSNVDRRRAERVLTWLARLSRPADERVGEEPL